MKIKTLFVYLLLVSCSSGGGSGGNSVVKPEVPTQSEPWKSHSVEQLSQLPACDEDKLGHLYYVESNLNFQSCKSTGWEVINIGRNIVSTHKLTHFGTLSLNDNTYYDSGSVSHYSDLSVELKLRLIGWATNSPVVAVMAETYLINSNVNRSVDVVHPHFVINNIARKLFYEWNRGSNDVKFWVDSNGNLELDSNDTLVGTVNYSNQ